MLTLFVHVLGNRLSLSFFWGGAHPVLFFSRAHFIPNLSLPRFSYSRFTPELRRDILNIPLLHRRSSRCTIISFGLTAPAFYIRIARLMPSLPSYSSSSCNFSCPLRLLSSRLIAALASPSALPPSRSLVHATRPFPLPLPLFEATHAPPLSPPSSSSSYPPSDPIIQVSRAN